MRKVSMLLSCIAGAMLLASTAPSYAAEKEKTITGEAKCAKCALKESDKCQTVVVTEGKNGKKVNYYLADNDVAKAFHKNVCSDTKKVTVIGTEKKDKAEGKHEFTATKIEPVVTK